ncbi:putative disease resistance RPP13-like protein 1 [Morella rubra]|uniref:Putative disease resistance RPP13-like protein 1 n=1 Tax=Morella rubra TaxID=262757 RepID=A0A6A1WQV5_9ROSI|nr:putative disease resistance RPP13-like protein 1 [Morella rubra]
MAEIATLFLSPLLQAFFDKVASGEFVNFFRRRMLDDGLLEKMNIALLSVNAVLEDAEKKQVTSPHVKIWLDKLKDVVFEAEDVWMRLILKPCDPSWMLNIKLLPVRIDEKEAIIDSLLSDEESGKGLFLILLSAWELLCSNRGGMYCYLGRSNTVHAFLLNSNVLVPCLVLFRY